MLFEGNYIALHELDPWLFDWRDFILVQSDTCVGYSPIETATVPIKVHFDFII